MTYPRTWFSPPVEALRGVSMSIEEGEVFGFIGPNGAGKSTLIKILTGAMRQSSGRARLFGMEVGEPESRRGLGYVPESPSLPDYLTPLEILDMGVSMHGLRLSDKRAHCMGWLDRFGLAHVANKVVRGFSKGMAQRAVLAHAMALQPRLLILDEPLSGLDPIGRREVVDILSEYCRAGGTLFFTSHVLHDVERLAHRYGLIHQGLLTAVRSPAELAGEDELITVRSLGTVALDGLKEEAPQRWFAEIPRSELWAQLEQLHGAGHVLIEVRPVLSLESAFMKAVSKPE
ncbi:MAG: ABC transporter ATP-binding protein [Rhodocyclaceae bacterium]|nr:ABC transporter ATP-binding protein [Rhodocyclaceae bacterium]